MNIPKLKVFKKHIESLASLDLKTMSYSEVYNYLQKKIEYVPYTIARIHAGHYIERARINNNNEIFNDESSISYIKDPSIIKQYGRANKPNQSMFYGSVCSDMVPLPRIVNCAEIQDVLRSKNKNDIETDFLITVGKWRVIEDFDVIEIVFLKSLIDSVPDIRRAYEQQLKYFLDSIPHAIKQIEFLLTFFSEEFSKKDISSDKDYLISAAYTNMALKIDGINGVIYPSVRTDHLGSNIAITPETVDNYLRLEEVEMFRVYVKKQKVFIDPFREVIDLGYENSDFKWINKKGAPSKLIEEYFR